MNVTRTVTVPALSGVSPGVYMERITGLAHFFCISTTGEARVRFDQSAAMPVQTGIAASAPGTAAMLTIENPNAFSIEIQFNAGPEPYKGQSAVQAVTSTYESASTAFTWSAYDGTWNSPGNANIISFSVPVDKPFRKVWCYFSFSNEQVGKPGLVIFSRGGTEKLWLPASYKADNTILPTVGSAITVGFALNSEDTSRDVLTSGCLYFNNSDGNGRYPVPPFPVSIVADTVTLKFSEAVPSGTLRTMLGVMSASQPW